MQPAPSIWAFLPAGGTSSLSRFSILVPVSRTGLMGHRWVAIQIYRVEKAEKTNAADLVGYVSVWLNSSQPRYNTIMLRVKSVKRFTKFNCRMPDQSIDEAERMTEMKLCIRLKCSSTS